MQNGRTAWRRKTTINAELAARLSRNQIDGSPALGGGPDGPPQKSSRLAKILTVSSAETAENNVLGVLCGLCVDCCDTSYPAILPFCNFVAAIVLVAAMMAGCGSGTVAPSSATTMPAPSPPSGPPQPSNGAALSITSTGFSVRDVHILQGSRLTFVNNDTQPHDVMSDPFHVHTDCPEINVVGFLTPGQSRASDPLNTIRTCGFHDHDHEGDERFHGTASIEAR